MGIEFKAWPKTPRLFRDVIITEKIDGTNACVIVDPEPLLAIWPVGQRLGEGVVVHIDGRAHLVAAQSRKRIITPGNDNFGFAAYVHENAQGLADALGVGYHYGEWWGQGIQRGYGLTERRFSLFNVSRYTDIEAHGVPGLGVVPQLWQGVMSTGLVSLALANLTVNGSYATEYGSPEGIIVYHTQSGQVYKVLLENDELPKSLYEVA